MNAKVLDLHNPMRKFGNSDKNIPVNISRFCINLAPAELVWNTPKGALHGHYIQRIRRLYILRLIDWIQTNSAYVTGNAVRAQYESIGSEAWKLVWKLKYVVFSRDNCQLYIGYTATEKFASNVWSNKTHVCGEKTLQLRKCLLFCLSMLATFPSSPSHSATRSGVAAVAGTTTDGWPPFALIATTIPDHSATRSQQTGEWTSVSQSGVVGRSVGRSVR